MANPTSPNGDKDNSATSSAQAELLQTVLESEQYPWLPSTSEADPLEAAGLAMEISDEDAQQGWTALSAQLNQMWAESTPESTTELRTLQAALMEKFSGRLPVAMIEQIGSKAQQLASNGQTSGQTSGQTILDQMVACVQDVVSTMATADLQVFGRPMAMAMRSTSSDEILDATIQSIRPVKWEALSPIEQAKLSLAVARYAISEVEK